MMSFIKAQLVGTLSRPHQKLDAIALPERFSPPREGPALLQGLLICGT
ncbi:MAG: hypothetical protein NVSMB27_48270 [Ktedonobacteraceae bacterium]